MPLPFDENSTQERVDEFLKDKYKLGIWEFSRCLSVVAAFHKTYGNTEIISRLKEKIKKLERLKSDLPKRLKSILDDYDINLPIKDFFDKYNIQDGMVNDADKLVDFFQLKHAYEIIDEKIRSLKENIRALEEYAFDRKKRPFRIEPINLVILVWGCQLGLDVKSTEEDFLILATLIRWFDKHTRWAEYFNWQSVFVDKSVQLTFFKYIKHRKRKDPKKTKSISYLYLVELLRLECFSDDIPSNTNGLLPNMEELEAMKEIGVYEPTDSLLLNDY